MPSRNYGESTSLTPALLPSHGPLLSDSAQGIITQGDPRYNELLSQMFLDTSGLDYQGRTQLQSSNQLTNNTVSQLTFCASLENHSVIATAPPLSSEDVYYPSPNTVATAGYNNFNFSLGGSVIRGGSGRAELSAAASNKTGLDPHTIPMMRLPSNTKMPSPESEPSPPASSSYLRKASFSSSSAAVPAPSEEDRSPAMRPTEAPPTNISRPIRRTESPPLNVNKKMICKFAECAAITFDRKCEWRLVECSNQQACITNAK